MKFKFNFNFKIFPQRKRKIKIPKVSKSEDVKEKTLQTKLLSL